MRRSTPLRSAVAAIVAAGGLALIQPASAGTLTGPLARPAPSRPRSGQAAPRRPAGGLRRGGRGLRRAGERPARRLLPGVALGRQRRPAQRHRGLRPDAPHRRRPPSPRPRTTPAPGEDARGDDARPLAGSREAAVPSCELPAWLRTAGPRGGADRRSPRTAPRGRRRPTSAAAPRCWPTTRSELAAPLGADPADWYGAVPRYSGADERPRPRRSRTTSTR